MAKFINDLGYSKENPFSPTREEREANRLLKIQQREFRNNCFKVNDVSQEALNYANENPILARATALPDGEPWVMEFFNSSTNPHDFELFNANVNYNVKNGGFTKPANNGESNDYQTWVGDGWSGSRPPYNPYNFNGKAPIVGGGGPTPQEIMYETIENPVVIKNIFFEGDWNILDKELEIKYKDVSGNFQLDTKRLVVDPYVRTGNVTLDSPITVAIDGFASVKLKDVPSGATVRAVIYPSYNLQTIDCIGGWPESMQL
jgi:hypothetical protein